MMNKIETIADLLNLIKERDLKATDKLSFILTEESFIHDTKAFKIQPTGYEITESSIGKSVYLSFDLSTLQ